MTSTATPAKALVFTVRSGRTGKGINVFHVLATDIHEARLAVENTIRHYPEKMAKLAGGNFTVHGVPSGTYAGTGHFSDLPACDFQTFQAWHTAA